MAKAFFIQSPPLKTGRTRRKSRPNPPMRLPKEENYKASVFYYWWAFLRLNHAYIKTCENNGQGPLAKLYADFGDVRGENFWAWWRTHSHLFSEPPVSEPHTIDNLAGYKEKPHTILIEVPLDKKLLLRLRQVRRILESRMNSTRYRMSVSYAQYPVTGKPVVAALDRYLRAWEIKQQYPRLPYADLYNMVIGREVDIQAAMKPKPRSKKNEPDPNYKKNIPNTQMGYRYVRYAEEIISTITRGEFPVFTKTRRNEP